MPGAYRRAVQSSGRGRVTRLEVDTDRTSKLIFTPTLIFTPNTEFQPTLRNPMRRIAAFLLVPALACVALAGCGSSAPATSSSDANSAVTVSGTFDKAPTVSIPKQAPGTKLVYSTPIKGSGSALVAGDVTLANFTVYKWSGKTHTALTSTYTSGGPQLIPPTFGLAGLTTAMKGARLGSRILAVLPPKYGYGTTGNSEVGVTGKDTLVWVVDLIQQYAPNAAASGTHVSNGGGSLPTVTNSSVGQAPVITIPAKKSPPSKLTVTTLIKGSGPKLATGDTVVAQYVGMNWRTGKVFDQSWASSSNPSGQPFGFQLGGQVIEGWNEGLVGVPVGSRVMLTIPPALGYGPAGGQASAGIKKTDTLVFVIDVVGYLAPGASS
jgi:FKBP-type peptidyl-prolyl cis-trans isomerase